MQTVRRASGDIHLTFHYMTQLNNTVWIRRTKINPSRQQTCPNHGTGGYDFYEVVFGTFGLFKILESIYYSYVYVLSSAFHVSLLGFYRHCFSLLCRVVVRLWRLLVRFSNTCYYICISYCVVLYSHTTSVGERSPFSAYSMYKQVRDVHRGIMTAVTQTWADEKYPRRCVWSVDSERAREASNCRASTATSRVLPARPTCTTYMYLHDLPTRPAVTCGRRCVVFAKSSF